MCLRYGHLWFQKITIRAYTNTINVQQILVVTFEFTGAARVFMSMSCAARAGSNRLDSTELDRQSDGPLVKRDQEDAPNRTNIDAPLNNMLQKK